jgi:predicted small metal-binding protein
MRCDEAGFRECNWEFLGESEEEVVRKAKEHGKRMHNVEVDETTIRSFIRDA